LIQEVLAVCTNPKIASTMIQTIVVDVGGFRRNELHSVQEIGLLPLQSLSAIH